MALQSSGQIKLSEIQTEFGGSNPIQLSEYYRGGANVPDVTANNGVPTSGEIELGDFYGASNIIYGARSISGFTNNSATLDTGNKKFGAASMEFNNNNNRIRGPIDTLSQLNGFDWTIQFWIYLNSTASFQEIMGNNRSGFTSAVSIRCGTANGGKMEVGDWGNGQFASVLSSTTVGTGSWKHYAIVKSGTNVKIFENGVQTASRTSANNTFQGSLDFDIGDRASSGFMPLKGNLDDIVIWKGVAKYSSTFTPPTTEFHPENDDDGDKVVLWMPSNTSVTEAYEGYLL